MPKIERRTSLYQGRLRKSGTTTRATLSCHEAYNVLFGPDIPWSEDKACHWCNAYHSPDVNCGPTIESKLKLKDEIDQVSVQNVLVMVKILMMMSFICSCRNKI